MVEQALPDVRVHPLAPRGLGGPQSAVKVRREGSSPFRQHAVCDNARGKRVHDRRLHGAEKSIKNHVTTGGALKQVENGVGRT